MQEKLEIVRMMEEQKLDTLSMNETKARGKGEWVLEGAKAFKSGSRRAKGGAALLFSNEMWKGIGEYKEFNERIMYVKMKVDGKILVVVSVYAPQAQEREEREHF